MRFVVGKLSLSSVLCLIDGLLHALRYLIGIEKYLPLYMPSCATCCLSEGAVRTQKSLLVGIEDGNEGDFGKVQSFSEEVNPH